jgi:hypothetical protein
VPRLPLLSEARLVVVNAPDDAVVLRPPPPTEAIADVAAAVHDALRFPLAGPPLEALAPRRGRVTLVVEPTNLPIPGAEEDPRELALAGTSAELERLGVPSERQTILVAGGLGRRLPDYLEEHLDPGFARRFRGAVVVHDAESPDLVEIGASRVPFRVNRALVDTDLVVAITAAETVVHGGPSTLVAAANPEVLRGASAYSLLETAASMGWQTALQLERELARRVPLLGVSLVLNHPRLTGAFRGVPYEPEATERVARSRLRRAFGLLPAAVRGRMMRSLKLELTAAAAFAGPPSVAHAEALLRAIDLRETDLTEPVDAIVLGTPPTTPYLPRERPNPLLAAYLGLGLALRLWRDAFPVADGGTAILLDRFHRRFPHPTQHPYRVFFQSLRTTGGVDPAELAEAERLAAQDSRGIEAYRAGRSCHPLLPFADWSACAPALGRLGAVLVAGCRDAAAARQLGFVPTGGVNAALTMARGRVGRAPRIGFVLAPPYFPVRVGR